MSSKTQAPVNATTKPSLNADKSGLLQRQCACGNSAGLTGECATCQKEKLTLQRKQTAAQDKVSEVPPIAHEALSLPRVPFIQAKLTIGASDDPLEREADRVADQVMTARAHPAVSDAPPRIQRFTGQPTGQADMPVPASVDRVLSSHGKPLEPGLQQDMEQRFGHDFSRVRVHTDAAAGRSARDVNANAYTVGNNVVFSAGKYAPNTREGKRLLAHELTHVVQQTNNNDFLQRGIDQLELEKCMASLGDNTKQSKGVIVDRDGGIATKEDLEQYEKECTERQLERQRRKQSTLNDLLEAVGFSIELIPGAVKRHAGEMAEGLLDGLIDFAKHAAKILAATTIGGALIGAIVGAGAGAAPGAEIGFEIGLEILEIYGLAMLRPIIEMAAGFISNLRQFLDIVFHANGDKDQLKKAANNLAEAVGILVSALLMALLAYLLKEGTERILKTKFAKTVGESRLAKWFKERANKETSKKWIGKFRRTVAAGTARVLVGISDAAPTLERGAAGATAFDRPAISLVGDVASETGTKSALRDVAEISAEGTGKSTVKTEAGSEAIDLLKAEQKPLGEEGATLTDIAGAEAPKPVQTPEAETAPPPAAKAPATDEVAPPPAPKTTVPKKAEVSETETPEARKDPKPKPKPEEPEVPETSSPKAGPVTDLYPRDLEQKVSQLEQKVSQYTIARGKTRRRRDEILSKTRALEAELDARTEASRQDTRRIEDESKQIGEQLTQKGDNEVKGDAKDQLLKRRQKIVEENRQLIAEREQLQSNKQRVLQAAKVADDEYIKGVSDSARQGPGHAAVKTRAGNKDEVFGRQGEELSTEHILARDIIRQKDDFQKLNREQQVEVFDLEATLVRMSAPANSSKRNLRWANWPESGWRQFTDDPRVVQRMARNEAKVERYIDDYMKWQRGLGEKPLAPDLELHPEVQPRQPVK